MKDFDVLKITYLNGDIKIYKKIIDFYNDYKKVNPDDTKNYDSFRYILNNNLYVIHDKPIIQKRHKLNILSIEKIILEEFIKSGNKN